VKRWGFYNYSGRQYNLASLRSITIDGQTIAITGNVSLPESHFCLSDQRKWSICKDNGAWQYKERGPLTYGPTRQIYEDAFVIVYGTINPATTDALKAYAIFLGNYFFYQGRASPPVISDIDFTGSKYDEAGYNIVIIGDLSSNSIAKTHASSFPVKFSGNSFSIGDFVFNDTVPLGYAFLTPIYSKFSTLRTIRNAGRDFYMRGLNPEDSPRLALVIGGNTPQGFEIAKMLFPLGSGMLIPDYTVVTEEIRWKGDGGMVAAGYWNNLWQFDEKIGYVDTTVTRHG
jgi:hypothetical protein